MADAKKPGGEAASDKKTGNNPEETPDTPVKFAKRPYEGPLSHSGDDDQHLFGPSVRPEEHPGFGASLGNTAFQPAPSGKAQWYKALRAAAKDPDAPESVKEIWGLVDMMQSSSKYNTNAFGYERTNVDLQRGGFNPPVTPDSGDFGGELGLEGESPLFHGQEPEAPVAPAPEGDQADVIPNADLQEGESVPKTGPALPTGI